MQNKKEEIMTKLETLAMQKSHPFCYSCYTRAPSGKCKTCGSDDLMRETSGGVEFGCDWVIKELISENLSPINVDEEFEESIQGIYPETVSVLWMEFDAMTVAKKSDPIAWSLAKDEWLEQGVSLGVETPFNVQHSSPKCLLFPFCICSSVKGKV